MTDLERTREFLTALGIPFAEKHNEIQINEGIGPVRGYSFFFVRFSFDGEGNLVEVFIGE